MTEIDGRTGGGTDGPRLAAACYSPPTPRVSRLDADDVNSARTTGVNVIERVGVEPRPEKTDVGTRALPAPLLSSKRLIVGSASDRAEFEADVIASRVVDVMNRATTPDLTAWPTMPALADGRIRRRIDPDALPRTPGPEGGALDEELSGRIRRSAGGGRPLPAPMRRNLSAELGTDLDDVRVHAESRIAPMVGARAFTIGRDMHFSPGEYQPGVAAGRRLIGHEIGHVIQQIGVVDEPAHVSGPADHLF